MQYDEIWCNMTKYDAIWCDMMRYAACLGFGVIRKQRAEANVPRKPLAGWIDVTNLPKIRPPASWQLRNLYLKLDEKKSSCRNLQFFLLESDQLVTKSMWLLSLVSHSFIWVLSSISRADHLWNTNGTMKPEASRLSRPLHSSCPGRCQTSARFENLMPNLI